MTASRQPTYTLMEVIDHIIDEEGINDASIQRIFDNGDLCWEVIEWALRRIERDRHDEAPPPWARRRAPG